MATKTTGTTRRTSTRTTAKSRTKSVDGYLSHLWDQKGTDLMFTAGAPPLMRVDGVLQPIAGEAVLTPDDTEALVSGLLSKEQLVDLRGHLELDFSFGWGDQARFRGNAFHQRHSLALALRM